MEREPVTTHWTATATASPMQRLPPRNMIQRSHTGPNARGRFCLFSTSTSFSQVIKRAGDFRGPDNLRSVCQLLQIALQLVEGSRTCFPPKALLLQDPYPISFLGRSGSALRQDFGCAKMLGRRLPRRSGAGSAQASVCQFLRQIALQLVDRHPDLLHAVPVTDGNAVVASLIRASPTVSKSTVMQ